MIYLNGQLIKKFSEKILKWAESNLAKHPWREIRTPYTILISEILLTRTNAIQVVPIYKKFIEKYPQLEVFLEAKYEILLDLMKSLGLLYRAKKMMILITILKEDYNSKIPETFKNLKTLPGIGDYGANAILCFGYNKKKPLIDTNFIRIFKRVFNARPKTKTPKTDKYLWEFAEGLVPDKNFVEYNYGVIDFASKICLSRKPRCNDCLMTQICYHYKKMNIKK